MFQILELSDTKSAIIVLIYEEDRQYDEIFYQKLE